MIELLFQPVIKNSLIALSVISFIFPLLGIFVIMRKISFLSEGIAHSSLLALIFAYFFSFNYLLLGIVWAIIFTILIFYLEKKTNLPVDALIIILFIISLSLGVILFSLSSFRSDLISILFGNILTINFSDLIIIIIFSFIIFLFYLKNFKDLLMISLNKELAYAEGIKVDKKLLLFYIFLGITVILGIKILGIIMVNALLILPPSIAMLISKSFKDLIFRGIILAEIISLAGFFLAYFLNFPIGPTIALLGGCIFLLTLLIKRTYVKI